MNTNSLGRSNFIKMTAQFWNRKLVWGALAEIFVDSYFQAKLFVPNLYQKRNKFFNLIFFPHAKNSQSKVWILPNHALSASEIWQESRSKCDGRLGRIWRIPQVNTEFTINHSECYIKISREDQKKYEFARIVRLHGVYTFLFNKEYWFPGYIDKDGYCERCCRSPLREIDRLSKQRYLCHEFIFFSTEMLIVKYPGLVDRFF